MVDHLAYAIGREAVYPGIQVFHARLETLGTLTRRWRAPEARKRVIRELADPEMRALLSNGDPQIEAALSPLVGPLNLPYVGGLARAARARRPPRQGSRKFYPAAAAGPDSREYCALIVSVAWRRDAGKWPEEGDPTAQFICELLWRKARGKLSWLKAPGKDKGHRSQGKPRRDSVRQQTTHNILLLR